MHAPYRIAAPPEPEGPDPADAYEALLHARATRGRRIMTAVCGGIAALSMLALAEAPPAARPRNEPSEIRAATRIAGAREAIAIARKQAYAEQQRFTEVAGTLGLLAHDLPSGSLGRSPNEMSAEGAPLRVVGARAPSFSPRPCDVVLPEASRLVPGKRAFPLLVVAQGDHDVPSPSLADVLAGIRRAEEHLDNGRYMEGILYANALSASRLRYDIVLVTSSMKHPVRTTGTSFEPGEVTGRAYLYDFAERRITCAGDVHASSSRAIEYSFVPGPTAPAALDQGPSLSASLDADLDVQIQRAIAGGALFKISTL